MSERETPGQGAPPTAVAPAVQQQQAPQEAPVRETGRDRPAASLRRIFLINGLGLLALILIGLGIFDIWHQGYYFYGTDDATVNGAIASIAPPATGSIVSAPYSVGNTVRANTTVATLRTATGATVRVVSPINGTIIQEGATPGEILPAGQPLAQVVDLNRLYITAYVEENHIDDVQVGQGVDVKVDAAKGATLHGKVSRILPVAASALSPLPSSDNSSGNFTKVTQRVPVQITLDGYQGYSLYPGGSAEVTIHIHE